MKRTSNAHRSLSLLAAMVALFWPLDVGAQSESNTLAELDATWSEVSRSVAEGDFDAYSAVYHPDAVLVSLTDTTPISEALEAWEPGFVAARAGESQPTVDFRFTQRSHDDTTAHETGIFRFAPDTAAGEPGAQYIHSKALMVKRDGKWLRLMEYQKATATRAEWDAAR